MPTIYISPPTPIGPIMQIVAVAHSSLVLVRHYAIDCTCAVAATLFLIPIIKDTDDDTLFNNCFVVYIALP